MAIENLQDNLNWLLLRASMIAKQGLIKKSEEHDLSPMQALTLCLLEPGGSVPMSMISDLLACDPSNVTGLVDRLSVGGYIERRESATDRRVKTISLTENGLTIRNKILPAITENHHASNLTHAETEQLKALLIKTLPAATTVKYLNSAKK